MQCSAAVLFVLNWSSPWCLDLVVPHELQTACVSGRELGPLERNSAKTSSPRRPGIAHLNLDAAIHDFAPTNAPQPTPTTVNSASHPEEPPDRHRSRSIAPTHPRLAPKRQRSLEPPTMVKPVVSAMNAWSWYGGHRHSYIAITNRAPASSCPCSPL
jgi:hypothetical protein